MTATQHVARKGAPRRPADYCRPILSTLTILLLCLGSAIASAGDKLQNQITLAVAANTSLEDALIVWAQKAGVQVMMSTADVIHSRAPTITGVYTARTALELLLRGSGLTYARNGSTVYIRLAHASQQSHGGKPATATPALLNAPSNNASAGERGAKPAAASSSLSHGSGQLDDPPSDSTSGSDKAYPNEPQDSLNEVVVSAERVQEKLINVPMSLTVLSASDLANLGATQFSDWADTVPGLTFNTVGAGLTQVVIRGMNDGADIGSSVATYIDDVPFGSSTSSGLNLRVSLDPSLLDIQRIEVLKGPQGTLYGASSMGGLISYTTTLPDLTGYRTRVQTGVSSIEDGGVAYDFAATLNAPLVTDKLAVRASAFENHDGGYVNNAALHQRNADSANTYGALLSLLYAPSPSFDVRLSGFAQNISRHGESTVDYTLLGAPFYGRLDQFRLVPEPFEQHFRLASATLHYDFGPVRLTSISSYQTVLTRLIEDYTPYYLALFHTLGYPYSAVGFANSPTSTNKFTEEDRLNSRTEGPVTWLLGLFYTHEISSGNGYFIVHDLSGNAIPNNILSTYNPSAYKEYAAYADVTLHATERLSLTAGVRESHNQQDVTLYAAGLFAGKNTPGTRSAATVPTYLANLDYHFLQNASAFLRFATGYRPGGPNGSVISPTTGQLITPPPYAADRVRDYEAGIKAQNSPASLETQLSLYYMNWTNIQLEVCSSFCYNGNASGGATLTGAEASLTARPAPSWTISTALGYEHAYLRQSEAILGALNGDPLPNVPKFTASLTTDYALRFHDSLPTVGLSARYVDARRVSFDKSTSFPQYRLPPYTIVDAHLTFSLFDDHAKTTIYLRNIFNRIAQLSAYTYNGPRPAIAPPRTVGVQISADL